MSSRPKIAPRAAMGAVALLVAFGSTSIAQTIAPEFAGSYTFTDLGTPIGVPGQLGGLTLQAGSSNTLLIGGNANTSGGVIRSIGLTRDASNNITGFSGGSTPFATAPNIDGGLVYGPNNVLFFTTFSDNRLGQIRPGSTTPDKFIDLTPLGIVSSVGAINFVPAGFPGAGEVRITSFNGGGFYSASLSPDGQGTFNLTNVALRATTGSGPEGLAYVPLGSPGFSAPSILISEFSAGRVSAYTLDVNGIPIVASRRDFITGLTGVEGAFIDPLSGNFLFSTFGGGNRVISVRGFSSMVPEPTSLALLGLGVVGWVGLRHRRRRVADA